MRPPSPDRPAWLPRLRSAAGVAALALLGASAAPSDPILRGTVTDAAGRPLGGAMVTARDSVRRITIAGTTDAGGKYRIDGLSAATYRVAVSLDGAELIGHVGPYTGPAMLVELPPHPELAAIPGGPIPYELRVAPDGRVWTSELLGNRLIAHVPGTGTFDVFEMPVPHSGPRRFDSDARGSVWIPACADNALVRLDPATRRFTRHALPIADTVPYVARVHEATGRIRVGTSAADAVFAFDPATGGWDTYPLPSRGAIVRHMAFGPRHGDLWLAYGASPGIAARVARLSLR